MINGNYRRIPFDSFAAPKAQKFLLKNKTNWLKSHSAYTTCGTGALCLLTGIPVKKIENGLKTEHWSNTAIVRFLNKHGYKTTQLTKFGVTYLSSFGYDYLGRPVTCDHVLLCNSLVCREEASWFVIHDNCIYHNFEIEPLAPLFMVNKPSQNIWLVTHDKWA